MPSRNILLAALAALLLCACSIGGESLTVDQSDRSQIYYFTGYANVQRDYINRYQCTDSHVVPVCSCTSRTSRDCDCRC